MRAIRATADGLVRGALTLEELLARYSECVANSAQSALRLGRGVYVMTAHQAKGKEFEAVILFNVSVRNFPDTDSGRRLFYVALTRASRRWVVLAPERDESPLVRHLGT